ncbi:hypothetical protein [Bartonella sp. C271]|uniref:hypothetical protein n=1 Tax=Bartonella sp. C271 TaxID=3070220 RepID=UPI0038B69673
MENTIIATKLTADMKELNIDKKGKNIFNGVLIHKRKSIRNFFIAEKTLLLITVVIFFFLFKLKAWLLLWLSAIHPPVSSTYFLNSKISLSLL